MWALDVEEGSFEYDGARYWNVDVLRADDARQEVQDRKEAAKKKKRLEQFEQDKRTICDTLIKFPKGETKSVIRDAAGIGSSRFASALAELISDRDIQPCKITKEQSQDAIRRLQAGGGHPPMSSCRDSRTDLSEQVVRLVRPLPVGHTPVRVCPGDRWVAMGAIGQNEFGRVIHKNLLVETSNDEASKKLG